MPALLTRISIAMPPASKALEGGSDRGLVGDVEGGRRTGQALGAELGGRFARRAAVGAVDQDERGAGLGEAFGHGAARPREEPVTRAVRPVRSKRLWVMAGPQGSERRTVRSERSKTAGSSSMPRPGPSIGRT